MKTDLEQVLEIKDVYLDPVTWNGQELHGYKAVTDGKRVFGVRTDDYVPVSHQAVLSRVQEFLPEGKVENVYTTKNLSRVLFNIKLPKVSDVGGEEIQTYVNLRNSLDGGWSLGLIVSPTRVICSNTFVLHFKTAYVSISERHIQSGVQKFFEQVPLVEQIYNALDGQLETARKLANLSVTTDAGKTFLTKLAEKHIIPAKVAEQAAALFEHPTRKADERRDFWRLLNSVTDVLSRRIEDKGSLVTFDQVYRTGEAFAELVEA